MQAEQFLFLEEHREEISALKEEHSRIIVEGKDFLDKMHKEATVELEVRLEKVAATRDQAVTDLQTERSRADDLVLRCTELTSRLDGLTNETLITKTEMSETSQVLKGQLKEAEDLLQQSILKHENFKKESACRLLYLESELEQRSLELENSEKENTDCVSEFEMKLERSIAERDTLKNEYVGRISQLEAQVQGLTDANAAREVSLDEEWRAMRAKLDELDALQMENSVERQRHADEVAALHKTIEDLRCLSSPREPEPLVFDSSPVALSVVSSGTKADGNDEQSREQAVAHVEGVVTISRGGCSSGTSPGNDDNATICEIAPKQSRRDLHRMMFMKLGRTYPHSPGISRTLPGRSYY